MSTTAESLVCWIFLWRSTQALGALRRRHNADWDEMVPTTNRRILIDHREGLWPGTLSLQIEIR